MGRARLGVATNRRLRPCSRRLGVEGKSQWLTFNNFSLYILEARPNCLSLEQWNGGGVGGEGEGGHGRKKNREAEEVCGKSTRINNYV